MLTNFIFRYLYFGLQSSGDYMQWPALGSTKCKNGKCYDPRLRPWYAIAASGSKDVLIVIDVSGSMGTHGRLQLAKDAVRVLLMILHFITFRIQYCFVDGIGIPIHCNTPNLWIKFFDSWIGFSEIQKLKISQAVMKTLTWVDFVSVISFSIDMKAASEHFVPATDQNKDKLMAWVDALGLESTTNYKDAPNTAFELVQAK